MTYVSPDSGNGVSYSWLTPMTLEALLAKRRNSDAGNKPVCGQLGCGPGVLAPSILMVNESRSVFGSAKNDNCDVAENIANYTRYRRENDLFLTHALGDPQDRPDTPIGSPPGTQVLTKLVFKGKADNKFMTEFMKARFLANTEVLAQAAG